MSSLPTAGPDNRFSPISEFDHAGYLWIASLIAGIYSLLSLFARSYIKRACLGLDDWACAAATAVSLASFAAVFAGLSQGLGKQASDLSAMQQNAISRSVFASQISLVLSLSLSKCSVILLIRRLFSQDMESHRRTCHISLAFTGLWCLTSVLGVSVRCDPNALLLGETGSCSGQLLRWQIIGIFDIISEVGIVLLSCTLVWQLQMCMELKLRVILAFLFRLPLVPIIVLHIYYMKTTTDLSADIPFTLTSALTCEQIEVGYSLLSATIPNLKSFITSFDTAMMMDISYKLRSYGPGTSADAINPAIANSSSTRPPRISDIDPRDNFLGRLRPERLEHFTSIQHLEDSSTISDSLSVGRSSREETTIRRDVHWRVEESYA